MRPRRVSVVSSRVHTAPWLLWAVRRHWYRSDPSIWAEWVKKYLQQQTDGGQLERARTMHKRSKFTKALCDGGGVHSARGKRNSNPSTSERIASDILYLTQLSHPKRCFRAVSCFGWMHIPAYQLETTVMCHPRTSASERVERVRRISRHTVKRYLPAWPQSS